MMCWPSGQRCIALLAGELKQNTSWLVSEIMCGAKPLQNGGSCLTFFFLFMFMISLTASFICTVYILNFHFIHNQPQCNQGLQQVVSVQGLTNMHIAGGCYGLQGLF